MKILTLTLTLILLTACSTPSSGTYYPINDPNRCGAGTYAVCDMHMGKPIVCECVEEGVSIYDDYEISVD